MLWTWFNDEKDAGFLGQFFGADGAAEAAKVDAASFKSQIRDAMDEVQVVRVCL